jgi:membrane-associated phospholipid phosphatase
MPSMHVSIAWLMALLGWRISRPVGWLLTAYCACIVLGSVHLGWHYAVDGYVSIILTSGIWFVTGRIIARQARQVRRSGSPLAA